MVAFSGFSSYIGAMEKYRPNIELELKKLDLNEKEIRVYLAMLETGAVSVKMLAEKIPLSRPTLYRIIENLEKKELAEKIRGKSSEFIAKSPDHLLNLIRIKKRRVEEQERELLRIISILKNKYVFSNENSIREYAGKNGEAEVLSDLSSTPEGKIFLVSTEKSGRKIEKLDKIFAGIEKRLGKADIRKIFLETGSDGKKSGRENSAGNLSGILIISDKAIYLRDNKSFSLQKEEIVDLVRFLAETIWKSAK